MSSADKWHLFRDLTTARSAWQLGSRDLTVLNALLSFHPGKMLEDGASLIVFPSNRSLADRAHGMAESTLRRHLVALVASGLILRHDSPNGKRYAARDAAGGVAVAFGFDLRPLLVQAQDIAAAAAEAREVAEACRRHREVASLRLRDATKLIEYGRQAAPHQVWEALADATANAAKVLRRKLCAAGFQALAERLLTLLDRVRAWLPDLDETAKMSGSDSESERHYQSSKTYTLRSEPCLGTQAPDPAVPQETEAEVSEITPLPLQTVLKACPTLPRYADRDITDWHHLVAAADYLRPMLGITPEAWQSAGQVMGRRNAAISLVCILERVRTIASPGGYLRVLTKKAAEGGFSPLPMVRALLNAPVRAAA